ncbi:LysR family transcriptional regulator [Halomonas salipaludis]|uniref:LysR family transcriptional regulator n=1 Tax=Halomonas salipaludis TaxID=2032625 RepID=A0A2A2ESK8_9GAMM|nr:LysR family transcriptional regulator [Halomonas salipaludis]PAU76106.1 LysR family transcriptional regulator [Halomonas salipaludis]
MNEKTSIMQAQESHSANRTLNLDAARTFVAICETGNFRRAAARVHRSPSAVSLQIGKLEEQLGVRLLHRDARHVRLTHQGERLLGFARRLVGISDEAMAAFHGSPLTGSLSVAAPHDLGASLVPSVLRRLAEAHPRIRVDVRLDTSEAVQRLFMEGKASLALFNEVNAPQMPARDLFSEELVWLMRDGGRAVEQDPLPLAVAEIGCAWRDAVLGALEKDGRSYRVAYSSDTSMGQVASLRADLAVAALPRSLVDHELVEVPRHWALPALGQTHIYLADDGSDTAKAFAELITPDLRRA